MLLARERLVRLISRYAGGSRSHGVNHLPQGRRGLPKEPIARARQMATKRNSQKGSIGFPTNPNAAAPSTKASTKAKANANSDAKTPRQGPSDPARDRLGNDQFPRSPVSLGIYAHAVQSCWMENAGNRVNPSVLKGNFVHTKKLTN